MIYTDIISFYKFMYMCIIELKLSDSNFWKITKVGIFF